MLFCGNNRHIQKHLIHTDVSGKKTLSEHPGILYLHLQQLWLHHKGLANNRKNILGTIYLLFTQIHEDHKNWYLQSNNIM